MTTLLSADLGGTKTLLRLSTVENGNVYEQKFRHVTSNDYASFEHLLGEFLENTPVDSACLAVAGPVFHHTDTQTASITNLPWKIDSQTLGHELAISRIKLINDFQAIGYGIASLSANDVITLQPGKPDRHGTQAIIGAGTGLGQAYLHHKTSEISVYATEGGHCDFAPTDDVQIGLLQFLRKRHAHVSYERILSGDGLQAIFQFMSEYYPHRADLDFSQKLGAGDAAAQISVQALANPSHLAGEALALFVKIYGAQAGNMALNFRCSSGMYIAGGIAPKILPFMQDGNFVRAFNDKGRMSVITEKIPVYLIINAKIGLMGAEYVAQNQVD
ncbi:MAG: glucokinase [Gammaproteobacteria bacterium]|nr:glucokinase [Gammaproteobacteria bacterium]